MPIKKRLSPEERLSSILGTEWSDALRYPLIAGIVHFGKYDTSTKNVAKAIEQTSGWRGASFTDKVFVLLLAAILYRKNGESFLTNANYDRLRKHLLEHETDVLNSCGVTYHGPLLWDLPRLSRIPIGELRLPGQANAKPKRQRLKRHR